MLCSQPRFISTFRLKFLWLFFFFFVKTVSFCVLCSSCISLLSLWIENLRFQMLVGLFPPVSDLSLFLSKVCSAQEFSDSQDFPVSCTPGELLHCSFLQLLITTVFEVLLYRRDYTQKHFWNIIIFCFSSSSWLISDHPDPSQMFFRNFFKQINPLLCLHFLGFLLRSHRACEVHWRTR